MELYSQSRNTDKTYKELLLLEKYIRTPGERAMYDLNRACLLYDMKKFREAADVILEIESLNPELDAQCAEVKTKIMIALNKPEEAHFYNQLQAQDIKGYFKENSLDRLEAEGNAASIYYLVDDDEAYVGVSQATSDKIEVFMVDQEIDVIKYLGPTDQVMQPLHLANTAEKKLERFNWRGEEKVKDWDAFFALTRTPTMPQLFDWEPLNAKRWGAPERKTPKLGTYEEQLEKAEEGNTEKIEGVLDKEITEESILEEITDHENAAEEGE